MINAVFISTVGLTETIVLLFAALITAGISGVLGVAGGVTLISLMTLVLPAYQVVPLHGIIQAASTTTRSVVMRRYVRWRLVAAFAPPMLLGTWLATMVWSGERLGWFRPAIGLMILLFLFLRRRVPRMQDLPWWVYPPVGLVIGFVNIFVGATGPLAGPFFWRKEFTKEEVIGTHAVCLAWGHLLKLPAFISLGFDFTAYGILLVGLLICVVCGALIGKHILGRISGHTFQILFEALLGVVALYLIGSWLLTIS